MARARKPRITRAQRIVLYLEKCVTGNRTIPLSLKIAQALKAITGRQPAPRTIYRWVSWIKQHGKTLYIFEVRQGRSTVLLAKLRFRRFSMPKSFYIGNRPTSVGVTCTTAKAVSKALQRLAFAILFGYRGGFGRYRQDSDWISLRSLHWDNCKIRFCGKTLYRTISDALHRGIDKRLIVATYDRLLRKWHGLATDAGEVWNPTGLARELHLALKSNNQFFAAFDADKTQ